MVHVAPRVETDAKYTVLPRPSYADTPSLAKESLLPVSEICETILHDLKESVAFTLSSKLDCANFLGVVRAILLNPTNAIVGLPTKLSKMKKRTPANHITLDSADSSIPGLLQVVHSMVAVEIVHLEECRNIFYLPWWLAIASDRAASLKSSRIGIFPCSFPS